MFMVYFGYTNFFEPFVSRCRVCNSVLEPALRQNLFVLGFDADSIYLFGP